MKKLLRTIWLELKFRVKQLDRWLTYGDHSDYITHMQFLLDSSRKLQEYNKRIAELKRLAAL